MWIYTSTPLTTSWRSAQLVTHKDNFTFLLFIWYWKHNRYCTNIVLQHLMSSAVHVSSYNSTLWTLATNSFIK
jgi:hypothetical protein